MDSELEQILVDKYPEITKEYHLSAQDSCMGRGFECGNGWYGIIDKCCEGIKRIVDKKGITVVFAQVKEKFGQLRIYVEMEGAKDGDKKDVLGLIDSCSKESTHVCETCGVFSKDSLLKDRNGWVCSVCGECETKLEE